jgi:hypothetical protein
MQHPITAPRGEAQPGCFFARASQPLPPVEVPPPPPATPELPPPIQEPDHAPVPQELPPPPPIDPTQPPSGPQSLR